MVRALRTSLIFYKHTKSTEPQVSRLSKHSQHQFTHNHNDDMADKKQSNQPIQPFKFGGGGPSGQSQPKPPATSSFKFEGFSHEGTASDKEKSKLIAMPRLPPHY